MIQLYDGNDRDFDVNGLVLMPESCTIKEVAGGAYELTMSHPVDPHGLWSQIIPGNLIKAPAPTANIEQISTADTLDVYRVTDSSAAVKAGMEEPTRVTYQKWYPVSDTETKEPYLIGEKVTYYGYTIMVEGCAEWVPGDGHNYQCIVVPLGGDADFPPPDMGNYWQRISDTAGGSSTILTLRKDEEFYLLEEVNSTWYKISTLHGMEGYIKRSQCAYSRTIKNEPIDPTATRDQLFRIYQVNVNTKTHRLDVSARHVFYDLGGILVDNCVIKALPPSVGLAFIQTSFMQEYPHTIVTNLTQERDGAYTQTYSYCNGVSALLDADTGFVPSYKARLLRDNWDVYIYRNDPHDRGVRLEYGKNLRGVQWTRNTDKLVNRVVPVAKNSDDSDLFLEDKWIDSAVFDSYPVTKMELLQVDGKVGEDDLSDGTWTVDSLRQYMREEAQKRFDVDNADKAVVQIKVDFTLLGDTAEYAQYRALQKLYISDTVTVIDPTVNLSQKLQVCEISWDAINQRYNSIRLGDVYDYNTHTISGSELKNGTLRIEKLARHARQMLQG